MLDTLANDPQSANSQRLGFLSGELATDENEIGFLHQELLDPLVQPPATGVCVTKPPVSAGDPGSAKHARQQVGGQIGTHIVGIKETPVGLTRQSLQLRCRHRCRCEALPENLLRSGTGLGQQAGHLRSSRLAQKDQRGVESLPIEPREGGLDQRLRASGPHIVALDYQDPIRRHGHGHPERRWMFFLETRRLRDPEPLVATLRQARRGSRRSSS